MIDELVSNAIEATEKEVLILRFGSTLIVINDGTHLELQEIQSSLLTAYETGNNKTFETNRGLGFISLYDSMKSAIIRTGNYELLFQAWDDIKVNQIDFVPGFKIEVQLNSESSLKYSYENIEQQLQNWIYWGDIKIKYGPSINSVKEIGHHLEEPLDLKRNKKYKYANLQYVLSHPLGKKVGILYKLTNVNVFRLLPISIDISDLVLENRIDRVLFIISHIAYLDSSRRSLNYWGLERITELSNYINNDLSNAELRNKTFLLISEASKLLSQNLETITDKFNIEGLWHSTILNQFNLKIKNLQSLLQELQMWDLLGKNLEYMGLKLFSMVPIIFKDHRNYVENHSNSIAGNEFRNWIKTTLHLHPHDLFGDIIVGILFDQGILSHQISLTDLQSAEHWVKFDSRIFSSPIIEEMKLYVVLHDHLEYLSDCAEREIAFSSLKEMVGMKKPIITDTLEEINSTQLILYHVKDSDSSSIPILIYPGYSPDLSEISVLRKWFDLWRELIMICSEITQLDNRNLEPVLVYGNKKEIVGCNIHGYLGLSIEQLREYDEQFEVSFLQKVLDFLLPAIHEFAHINIKNHTVEFSRYQSSIIDKITCSKRYSQLISNLLLN